MGELVVAERSPKPGLGVRLPPPVPVINSIVYSIKEKNMLFESALFVLVGMFIGWNLPQPWWARYVQEKVVSWVSKDDG